MNRNIARRRFLQTSAGATAWWVSGAPSPVFSQSPNENINVACIGVGGKGVRDSMDAANYGNIVAICDIDDERLGKASETYPKAKKFNDYRKLLDEMESGIDAVVVSAPDHHHASAGVRAMRMGKHIYCQKPLTHSVAEARLMRETAREYNVVSQMGNQGTAADGFRAGVELLQAKPMGEVTEVHAWTNRPFKYWKQAPDIVARPSETPAVPSHVHWDLFLGPAPVRPYNPVYHPHDWRGWWDFGTGSLGDMACHTANLAFHGLKLGLPTRVSAISGEINSETYPAWATITYEFPAREEFGPVKFTWYEGAKDGELNLPPKDLFYGEKLPASGMIFVGEEGSLLTPDDYGAEQRLLPRDKFKDYKRPEPRLSRLGTESFDDGQKREWFRAMKGEAETMSNFDIASTMTESMLLGNVAVRLGEAIDYDGKAGRVTNNAEAARLLDPGYREGWGV
jgi:predicted dehydrogenase